jgi:hypothetical protein
LSFYCAVCNGLESLIAECPHCQMPVEDYGRFNDYLGPYSPYRPIEDISLTNGYEDLQNHQCMHIMSCSNCGDTFMIAVNERQG